MALLSQISRIRAGHPFRSKLVPKEGAGVHVIQMKDVDRWEGIRWETVVETTPHTTAVLDWVQAGDILLTSRGLSTNAIHVEALPYEQVLAAPHFYLISVIDTRVKPEFLAWQINQKPCQNYLRRNLEGSTTKSIRRELANNIPIIIPSLDQQKKIVKVHQCITKERALAKRLIENGEKLMTGIAMKTLTSSSKETE